MRFRRRDEDLLPWPMTETISADRAASILGCSISIVCELIHEGEIKGYKLRPMKKNSPWRVHYNSVLEYLEKVRRLSCLESEE